MQINIPYYEDNTRYSNSNIGQYIKYGPKYLRDYLDKKEDGLSASFLEKGSMIHAYILQPEIFWKEYVILEFEVPKSKQQKEFCEIYMQMVALNPLQDKNVLKTDAYRKAYSNNKTDNQCIKDAEEIIMCYQDYLESLSTKDKRKRITFADLQMLKRIKKNLEEHKLTKKLLFNVPLTTGVYNEFHINWEYNREFYDIYLPCKSLLDRVHIDEDRKEITLIDLKTTSNLYDFEHSMETYDYCRQFEYYWLALDWYMKNERGIDIMTYTRKTYVIAISTSGSYQVRTFNIKPEQLADRFYIINSVIEELAWHHTKCEWQYKREYYEGDGSEQLKLKPINNNE